MVKSKEYFVALLE